MSTNNSSFVWTWKDENPKQTKARPVYEEFEPSLDWIWDDEKRISDTLAVFLPGFKAGKGRLEISRNGVLRLSGVTKFGEAILIRKFDKEIEIPKDIDIESINAKFEGCLLYINLPKVITATSQQPPPSSIPQQQLHFDQPHELVMNKPESPPKLPKFYRSARKPPAVAPAAAHEPPLPPLEEEEEDREENNNNDRNNREEGKIEEVKTNNNNNDEAKEVEELKKHNKRVANLVVVMFLVVMFLLYVNNAIKSSSLFGGGGPTFKINQEKV
ncbi:hypothetical protein PIB30_010643 [Stylosanthes scabra]|uniref:SHSP domain-containing protein n=1 Tax=Stylosanthes scabra TaxID=79078 RepID=A0ABU6V6A3_9FABA|nr:hypothetical protein [Stylosanthes scabra]